MSAPASLAQAFDEVARRAGPRLAVRETGRDWSFAELLARSQGVSRLLESLGVRPGQRVVQMLPNSGAFAAAFFGAVRTGAVFAPLNVRFREQELTTYLGDIQPAVVLAAPGAWEHIQPVTSALPQPPALAEVSPDGGCRVVEPGGSGSDVPTETTDESPPLLHRYTSGSTGDPKRVVRSHANVLLQMELTTKAYGVTDADRFLGLSPFSHDSGLVRTMNLCLLSGATLFPVPGFRRREFLRLMERERITLLNAGPSVYVTLAEMPLRDPVDLSSLRVACSSAAPLLPEDNQRFHAKYGIWVRQAYGATEMGSICFNRHPQPETRLGSVGRPLDGIRVEIFDEEGRAVAVGTEGEVAVNSPTGIRAYAGNPEATARSFRDGFFLTGDLGRVDDEGYVTLTGRKKHLINRAGFMVNPLEVEEAVRSHPKVRDVAVVGVPGSHGNEIIRCVVVAADACTREEILEHCGRRIADFKLPSQIEFRDELPKTETGKVLRGRL